MTDSEMYELWLSELGQEFANMELREIFNEGIQHDKFFEVAVDSE